MKITSFILYASVGLLIGCDKTAPIPQPSQHTKLQTTMQPIKIGYSDWPGWVAWQIAIDKGWFKEAGLEVEFKWFDYSASMNAFAANQLDAISISNGDNLVVASGGTRGMMIMATDYSAGNDVIIAKSGVHSIADLKGKTIAVEKGLVDHHLLNTALQDAGIQEHQVKLINAVTNELPQVFASPQVDAIAVWQPVANQALNSVAGAQIIYSSQDKPGLIYDTLTVNMTHLARHPEAWKKIIQIWDRTVHYIEDPKTRQDALNIMAKRVGVDAAQYQHLLEGTHLLDIQANQKVFEKSKQFDSIYGSTYHVNQFNVDQGVYTHQLDVDGLIYPQLLQSLH